MGHIICVSGHGVGKVVEFLNNGGFGVKSAHLIEFGDPFADGSSECLNSLLTAFLIAAPRQRLSIVLVVAHAGDSDQQQVKLKRKQNNETAWLWRAADKPVAKFAGGFTKTKHLHGLPPQTPKHTLDIFKEANRLKKQQTGKHLTSKEIRAIIADAAAKGINIITDVNAMEKLYPSANAAPPPIPAFGPSGAADVSEAPLPPAALRQLDAARAEMQQQMEQAMRQALADFQIRLQTARAEKDTEWRTKYDELTAMYNAAAAEKEALQLQLQQLQDVASPGPPPPVPTVGAGVAVPAPAPSPARAGPPNSLYR